VTNPNLLDLQPGDVGLDAGRSPLSFAIKMKTWSDVSHAWLYVGQAKDISALADHEPESHWVISAERRSVVAKWWRKVRGAPESRHEGVNYYPLDLSSTVYLLRPVGQEWNRAKALAAFEADCEHGRCRGSHYDTFGLLLSFYGRRFARNDDAGFCSEATRQAQEWGDVFTFPSTLAVDATAPSHFLDTPALRCYWQRGA
jgi:hypothetical protein